MDNEGNGEKKVINGKAVGSLLIGILSMIGFLLIEGGSVLSFAGLLLGLIGLREIKKFKQNGKIVGLAGIYCNSLCILVLMI